MSSSARFGGPTSHASVTVGELVAEPSLRVQVVAGDVSGAKAIAEPRIQKPGLALTGWPEQLHPHRVLVLGGTEIEFLAKTDDATRQLGIATLLASAPACVVVCRGLRPPALLVDACQGQGVPLLASGLVTADFIALVTAWMHDVVAPRTEIHGVLLDVLGIGVLLTGKSGIGKSETALDLVVRGHRLVADDIVTVLQRSGGLLGRSSGVLGHHMEIRGLGIINIKDIFGISAVRDTKRIDLVVELVDWSDAEEYDRLGIDDHRAQILDLDVTRLRVPVRPGRNVAILIEVAARNELLKAGGHHSARAFRDHLQRAITEGAGPGDSLPSLPVVRFPGGVE